MTESVITQHFAHWRSATLGGRLYIEGLVPEEQLAPSSPLCRALASWDGHYYWDESWTAGSTGRWLVLVREMSPPRERWWLHAALFLLTLFTTTLAGTLFGATEWGTWGVPDLRTLLAGTPFSLALLAILSAHESGHYFVARYYRVNASPPFFVPFLPRINVIGTMGAFIRIRSPVFDRRTLFDIGVAGPLAGLAVALPVLAIGLLLSVESVNAPAFALARQYTLFAGVPLFVGDSLLLAAMRAVLAPDGVLLLHPLAVAGWVGVFVTMLNLLPLAQLDGGHVSYALFGPRQRWIARAFWLLLLPLGWLWWGWWLWAIVGLALGRGRLGHPRVVVPERPVGAARSRVGWVAIAIFLLTFMPLPILIPL